MKMDTILSLKELDLKEELRVHLEKTYEEVVCEDGFLYAKGTVPVLLVAHLDTVHKTPAPPLCYSENKRFIMSPHGVGGDDRCGVYMILQIVKELKCHIVFCEQEEVGCVGAKKFTKSKIKPEVNYIIEFDRKGYDDAVYYDCGNKDFESLVTSFGFKTQSGSCSDISHIAPYLDRAAVNISSGYLNPHCLYEFIDMKYVEQNAETILDLIRKNQDKTFLYEEKKYNWSKWNNTSTYTNRNVTTKYEKKTETKAEKNQNTGLKKGNYIITKFLMPLERDLFWIHGSDYEEVNLGEYWIDFALNVFIEIDGITSPIKNISIYTRDSFSPPEFVAKFAKLCNVNYDESYFS